MTQEFPKFEGTSPATLVQKIKLVYEVHYDRAVIEKVRDPDTSLTFLENLWYIVTPALLKTGSTLLKGTLTGNLFGMAETLIPDFPPSIKGENMNPSIINIVTNVIAFLFVILEPVKSYLSTQPFDWGTFAVCILGAIVSAFTGKSGLFVQKNP